MNAGKLVFRVVSVAVIAVYLGACVARGPGPTLVAASLPSARGYHQMAYDSESDRVILFGGESNPESGAIGGTWAYDLNAHGWREMTPDLSPPQGAGGDALAYAPGSDQVIMFVGSYFFGALQHPEGAAAGETWAYDFGADLWTEMESTGSPFGLIGARMAYDAESDRMILFGGADAESFEPTNSTWTYNLKSNTWTRMHPAVSPPRMNFHVMAYDNSSDRVVLFGIEVGQPMWVYNFNTDSWDRLEPAQMPPSRSYSSMVYDARLDRMILFGGAMTPTEAPLSDTWAYDLDANTWTELAPHPRPDARGWHATAYSSKAQAVLLFGGGADRESFTDETWLYDPARNIWAIESAAP